MPRDARTGATAGIAESDARPHRMIRLQIISVAKRKKKRKGLIKFNAD